MQSPVARTLRYFGEDQRREGRLYTSPDEGGGTASLPLRETAKRGPGPEPAPTRSPAAGHSWANSGTAITCSGPQSGPGRCPETEVDSGRRWTFGVWFFSFFFFFFFFCLHVEWPSIEAWANYILSIISIMLSVVCVWECEW
ncbi:hypothetical protein ANANG_G00016680 [Anguilla anguilla]|uniref:Uncharacterized protein n=1 Tax=Anguilla anguilla TaxID=7936 RepID=A0A9D3S6B0_ANGAN|nr:hypothetical protein ANANG_G00016680 [Anguilla anguilla]